jgi:hypothetical protein
MGQYPYNERMCYAKSSFVVPRFAGAALTLAALLVSPHPPLALAIVEAEASPIRLPGLVWFVERAHDPQNAFPAAVGNVVLAFDTLGSPRLLLTQACAGPGNCPNSLTSTLSPAPVFSPTANAIVWQGIAPTNTMGTIGYAIAPTTTLVEASDAINANALAPPFVSTARLTWPGYAYGTTRKVIINGQTIHLPLSVR